MRVVYISNYFNHHQKPLSDAMYRLLGDEYCFVETSTIPQFRLELGYQVLRAPYVLNYVGNTSHIEKLVNEADVVIYGEAPLNLIKSRYLSGKLTFRDDESRYKNPNRFLKWPIYTFKSLVLNKGYLLCASAYAPIDYLLSGMNPEKCFRWGYFTKLKQYEEEALMKQKREQSPQRVSILWAGRLIALKHPEAVVFVAHRLKKNGYSFIIRVIGSGDLEGRIKSLIEKKGLNDCVDFLGAMPPERVRTEMESSDIFLFTSDRREGWGAVLNESMNSGCAVVADGNIGSVPYLIENGVNGLVYRSRRWRDLCDKVEWLVTHPKEMNIMGRNAYRSMVKYWNGETAATNLLALSRSILQGELSPIIQGPCSHAPLLMRRWLGRFRTL